MIGFVSLVSGSSGNSSLISDGETTLLIDCGMSGALLKQKLDELEIAPEDISAILVTHEHTDHTKGVGIAARRYGLDIYATSGTLSNMQAGKIDAHQLHTIEHDKGFSIGSIDVLPFEIPHDAAEPVGFNLFSGGKKYTLATDIGFMPDPLYKRLEGSEYIILESNHDVQMLKIGSYPPYLKKRILGDYGHMSNDLTAQTVIRLANSGTKHVMLAHLSNENNTPEIAEITSRSALCSAGFKDIDLSVAGRYEISRFAV